MRKYATRYLDGEEKRAEWNNGTIEIIERHGEEVDLILLSRTEARKLALFILECLGD